MGFVNFPIAAHLSRTATAPKFSGHKEDWTNFIHKFESWVRVIAQGRALSEEENLLLLNSCLPEGLQKEMQLWEREKGRMPSFVEFRANLEAKFGRAQSETMRRKWMEVHMPKNFGKITLQHFEEFRVNFKLAMADVVDVTPEEARRVLMEKLAPFMKSWVIEAESKRMKSKCVVELTMRDGLTPDGVKNTVKAWTGILPLKVEVRGNGVYWLLFGDERLSQKLLELHGRVGQNSGAKISVRVVEQHLSVDDIFYEVGSRMEIQEKTAEYQRRGVYQQNYAVREAKVSKKADSKKGKPSHSGDAGGGTQKSDASAAELPSPKGVGDLRAGRPGIQGRPWGRPPASGPVYPQSRVPMPDASAYPRQYQQNWFGSGDGKGYSRGKGLGKGRIDSRWGPGPGKAGGLSRNGKGVGFQNAGGRGFGQQGVVHSAPSSAPPLVL